LQAGQRVVAHGAAGAVGSMVTQLARLAGAYVIGTGRGADRQKVLDLGAREFVDLESDSLEDVGVVDLVFEPHRWRHRQAFRAPRSTRRCADIIVMNDRWNERPPFWQHL
jgi:NADPH:quinone reductase-like Zn-dependent oxidoreductase